MTGIHKIESEIPEMLRDHLTIVVIGCEALTQHRRAMAQLESVRTVLTGHSNSS